MNCLTCGHKNPGTVSYCQACGAKLDLTADEIRDALVEKARGEVIKSTEFYATQSIKFAVVILLIMVTLFVLASGAPEEIYDIPSVSTGTGHLSLDFKAKVEIPRLVLPINPRLK